jgi:cellulose synthase/poly-beta-1,6-N-acetylglucosamine synthase-like glycosyltransferase
MDPFLIPAWFLIVIAVLYFLMVLVISTQLYPGEVKTELPDPAPFVTVVIAARNEEENIIQCLSDMVLQDYPRDRFEVIVADDHSEDHTVELCRNFIDSHRDCAIKLDSASGGADGKKAALARAIAVSKGELILSTDADTHHKTGWISSMTGTLATGNHQMVLGPVALESGKGLFCKIQAAEFLGIMGITAGSAALGLPLMCNGANLLYRKAAYEEAGGFSGNMEFASGDDQFLMMVTRKNHGRNSIVFNNQHDSIVLTEASPTLKEFLRQRIRWVSKSRGYSDPVVIASGIVTYLLNALLLAGLIAGCFNASLLYITLFCFGLKAAGDLLVVWPMSAFFRQRWLILMFLPAQVFQVVYVTFTGLAGLIVPYRWKGRLIRA